MALTIIGIFIGLLLSNQGNFRINFRMVRVIQMVALGILTICMAFAFKRLSDYQKKDFGVFANFNLMKI